MRDIARGVARNSFWVGIPFYCTILQSYILAAWWHRLQLVHKIIFRDWFWEGMYTDIPHIAMPLDIAIDTCAVCAAICKHSCCRQNCYGVCWPTSRCPFCNYDQWLLIPWCLAVVHCGHQWKLFG